MSSFSRVLPRVLRPVSAPARSLHVSAGRLDNTPPPAHRAIIVDLDRIPNTINTGVKWNATGWRIVWGSAAFVLATVLYNSLTPKDWAGNLGYTAKEKEEQKKQKEAEEH